MMLSAKVATARLVRKAEAAIYCGLSTKSFAKHTAVVPIKMPNGVLLYDVVDLDEWIDTLKEKSTNAAQLLDQLR